MALYIALSVFSYSMFMDRWSGAYFTEAVRIIVGLIASVIFLNAGDAPAHFYSWRTVLYCYFILSLMGLAHGFFQPKLAHTTKEISR